MSQGTVTANGVRIWYETFGEPDGSALLLIMGLGSQAVRWDDDFCRRLAAGGHLVIRFDNRDVGLSQWCDDATEPYSLDDMAEDTAGLLDALGIERAHVVGVSMGGMIAQLMAIHHPHKVASITSIMSTTGDPALEPPSAETISALMTPPGPTREERIDAGVAMSRLLTGPRFPFDEARLRERAAQAVDRAWHPMGTLRQLQAIVQAPSRVEALRRVTVPTLVIHGTADPLVPYPGGESTAKAIPGARLIVIEGMGHEIPPGAWDVIIPAILEHTA